MYLIILLIILVIILFYLLIKINKEFFMESPLIFYDEKGEIINHLEIERPEQEMAIKYIKPTDVVLELGARFGTVSCTINRILNNKKNQVSCEPDKLVWECLEKNKQVNNCNFNILKGFISNKKLDLINSGYGSYATINDNSEIKSYTLDEVKSMYNLTFNVLVLDCEGCMEDFIQENPVILNELNLILFEADRPEVTNYDKIRELLKSNNFIELENGFQNAWGKNRT